MVGAGKQFGDQTHQYGLESQNKKHHAQREKRRRKNRDSLDKFTNKQSREQNTASQNQEDPCSTKKSHGLMGIIEQELYREQIQDNLYRSFQAVFGLAKSARVVANRQLGDPRPHRMDEDRDEAMHLTIQAESL